VLLDNQMVNASVALATTISPLKKHERERRGARRINCYVALHCFL
jgi:hypothetical protein